jgi:hypothetical protein
MSVYGNSATRKWFEDAYKQAGKKLDMGKSCVRFKTLDDLPLDVIAQAIARVTPEEFIAVYERSRATTTKKPAKAKAASRRPAKKPASKKRAKKPTSKAPTKKKRPAKKTAKRRR